MSTTTIRLTEELKGRLAKVAERRGSSAHALILDAIAERVAAEEERARFLDDAERRYAEIAETGETLSWDDMKRFLRDPTTPKPETSRFDR